MAAAGIDSREFGMDKFIEKYSKVFESKLMGFVKKLKVPMQNVILAKDCPRDTIWRMDVYKEYKQNRGAKTSKQLEPEVFSHTYNEMLPRLLKTHKIRMISYKRAEADDIIAIIHGKLRKDYPESKIYVLTCDTDLLQLIDDMTVVYDFQLKSLVKASIAPFLDVYVRWKVIQGDVSDNIPAIDTKIGKVTAEKLARNEELLKKRLENERVRQDYERNDLLINLARIPEDIRLGVEVEFMKNT